MRGRTVKLIYLLDPMTSNLVDQLDCLGVDGQTALETALELTAVRSYVQAVLFRQIQWEKDRQKEAKRASKRAA